ncbi:uncharacterized protein [Panulirus ornatus]|uniref:uncharacterized protein isoform X2 n=1 Tax=Panulirus ornatus TaxID=150431 RepID=UPI003A885F58
MTRVTSDQGGVPHDGSIYPPEMTRVTSDQGGVPQDGSIYPPEMTRVTSDQGGVPQDGSVYPPEMTRVTSDQGGVPQDGSVYPPEMTRVTSDQGGVPQDGSVYPPEMTRVASDQGGVPQDDSVYPPNLHASLAALHAWHDATSPSFLHPGAPGDDGWPVLETVFGRKVKQRVGYRDLPSTVEDHVALSHLLTSEREGGSRHERTQVSCVKEGGNSFTRLVKWSSRKQHLAEVVIQEATPRRKTSKDYGDKAQRMKTIGTRQGRAAVGKATDRVVPCRAPVWDYGECVD